MFLLNFALPPADISKVSAVIVLPASLPLNTISWLFAWLSIVICPEVVTISTSALPVVMLLAATEPPVISLVNASVPVPPGIWWPFRVLPEAKTKPAELVVKTSTLFIL